MDIKILNKNVSTSLIAIVLSIFAFVLTIFFIIIFKVEDKTISIINFYEYPVNVTVKNSEYTIGAFDAKEIVVNTNNSINVSVTDSEGNPLQNMLIDGITRSPQLISIALNPINGYCFFNSKIVDIGFGVVKLDNKIVLNSTPVNYAISDMNKSFAEYAYPGKKLEVESNTFSKPINYIYPISCNLINNDESILATISAFSDYNPEDQLKYLKDIKAKISQSDNIDSLNSSLTGKASKYYISDDKYLFLYQ